jgi:hypothetical protein
MKNLIRITLCVIGSGVAVYAIVDHYAYHSELTQAQALREYWNYYLVGWAMWMFGVCWK